MKWKVSTLCVDLNESKLNVREGKDKLFEIVPKLAIEPDFDVGEHGNVQHKEVRVIAASRGGSGIDNRFGVAIDSDFFVFPSSLEQLENKVEFDAVIDFILWRRSILVIGLASSKIMLLNPVTFEIYESRKVSYLEGNACERFFVDAFLHSNPDPTKIDLLVMGVDGLIYTFVDVCLSTGSLDSTHDDNCSIDIDIATIKGTAKRCLPEGVKVVAACSPGRAHMITGDENGTLAIFKLFNNEPTHLQRRFPSINIKEMLDTSDEKIFVKKMSRFDGLLFVLFSNGHLEILFDEELFPIGKVRLPSSHQIVHDFEIVIMSADVIKMWVLFSNMEENDHFIGIAAGSRFNMEFIVRIPGTAEDSIGTTFKFAASVFPFEEPKVFIEITAGGTTKVYEMEELSTDVSLQNLLIKRRFDKAELLAKRYDKDLDLVWKSKVSSKYRELFLEKTEVENESVFREIIQILSYIKDPEFVCGFTIELAFPRLEWLKELLEIGMVRVGECSGSENGRRLLTTVKKFYTFQQVLPDFGIERWNEFNSEKTSMFLQCLGFLQNIEFAKAEIVWLRHCDEFLSEVELPDFAAFFKKLFWKRLDSPEAISLFKTILPCAVEKCESEASRESRVKISALLSLVNNQIRALEREAEWPEEGIRFTATLLTVVEEEEVKLREELDIVDEPHIHSQRIEICQDILKSLHVLIQALQDLKQLKYSHSIRIAFDKYIADSKTEVINTMLGVLFMKDEVELLVKDFLIPLAKRNNLDVDEILEQHIMMVVRDVHYFITSGSIPFEERVVTLVEFIQSYSLRLGCILRIAQEWPVPWYTLVEEVVKRAIKLDVEDNETAAGLQIAIKSIHVQVPYRCLMLKYRLTASKLNVAYNVVHTIKRILKSQKDRCYEDCLELVKHTGKCDAEEVRRIKFWYELAETEKSLDDILGEPMTPELTRRFLNRILQQFRQVPNLHHRFSEPWERYTECGRILANRLQDEKTIQFFQLRTILSNLWSDDIVHSRNYPFSALQCILEEKYNESSSNIIQYCNTLSRISFTHLKDILVTAGSFFCEVLTKSTGMPKVWDIVTKIVHLPGYCHDDGEIVAYAGLRIAHTLILEAATMSTDQLEILQEFLKLLLHSYATPLVVTEPVVKLMRIISIFQELRDKEIPLHNEFLDIYKEVWRYGRKGVTQLLTELQLVGESLLRFGDMDLFSQIFTAVYQEYLHQAMNGVGPTRAALQDGANEVDQLRLQLLQNIEDFEVLEKNMRVVNLVKCLNTAGLGLNAYALRQRNKTRLIEKLVEMNLFHLASQTALIFDFRDGPSWSKILREYVLQATTLELKTLLEALKRISELWVLPEFKEAWLKVSDKHPSFRHMCPIPLLGN